MNNENTDKQLTVWQVSTMMTPIPYARKIEEIHPVAIAEKSFCIEDPIGVLTVLPFGSITIIETKEEFIFFRTNEEAYSYFIQSQKNGILSWLTDVEKLLGNATQLPYMARELDMSEQGCKHFDYEKVMMQLNGFFRNWEWLDRLKYLAEQM